MYASAEEPNADTPNIGFENGNFTNWQLYTGYYSLQVSPDKDSSVVYDWKSVQWSEAKDRFDIMNLHKDDDIIACWPASVIRVVLKAKLIPTREEPMPNAWSIRLLLLKTPPC